MHDDGGELRIVVDVEAEQEHRGLSGDEHLDAIGQLEAVGCLPTGLMDELRDEQLHPFELLGREQVPVHEVVLEHLPPGVVELDGCSDRVRVATT